MLSNLHFCGQEASPGINYDSCPKWGSCKGDKGDAEKSFWSAISVEVKLFSLFFLDLQPTN